MTAKLTTDIDYYRKSCMRLRTTAWILHFFSHDLPYPPADGPVGHVGMLKTVFSRAVIRMTYFAEQFVKHLEHELVAADEMALQPDHAQEFGRQTDDALFFNFDAFVFSSKVITEKNLLDTGRTYFHTSIRGQYNTFIDGFLVGFNVRLRDIRNEISHVNRVGTAIGSTLFCEKGNITIRSEHNNGKDLILLFDELFRNTIAFIEGMNKIILNNDCAEYGFPTKDMNWNNVVKTSEYVAVKPQA